MIETILARRSVRDGYTNAEVPEHVLDQVLRCGLAAPSSKNAQPWRIHVVTDRPFLRSLADDVQKASSAATYVPVDPSTGLPREWRSTVAESAQVLREVPVGLFIENSGRFSDGRAVVARARPDIRENALVGYGFEMIGLGAAIVSMWIAASGLGLGGVFMGDVLIAEAAIRYRLGVSGDLVGVLALGYSVGCAAPRRLAEGRIVRHDRWRPGPGEFDAPAGS